MCMFLPVLWCSVAKHARRKLSAHVLSEMLCVWSHGVGSVPPCDGGTFASVRESRVPCPHSNLAALFTVAWVFFFVRRHDTCCVLLWHCFGDTSLILSANMETLMYPKVQTSGISLKLHTSIHRNVPEAYSVGQSGRSAKLTVRIHLLPRLRMRWAVLKRRTSFFIYHQNTTVLVCEFLSWE